jgi:hypothetical protein
MTQSEQLESLDLRAASSRALEDEAYFTEATGCRPSSFLAGGRAPAGWRR